MFAFDKYINSKQEDFINYISENHSNYNGCNIMFYPYDYEQPTVEVFSDNYPLKELIKNCNKLFEYLEYINE